MAAPGEHGADPVGPRPGDQNDERDRTATPVHVDPADDRPGDAAGADRADADHPDLDAADLRPVVEYAVAVAAAGRRRRPPLTFPDQLRPFLDGQHVSKRALGRIRRALQDAPDFRRGLAAGLQHEAVAEVVDEVGRLWLERPPGWHDRLDEVLAARRRQAGAAEAERTARREEKRRRAAEAARSRLEAELAGRDEQIARLREELDELRADLGKALEEAAEQRVELQDARVELRHARDRERSARDRLELAERDRDAAEQARRQTAEVRDDVLAERADAVASLSEVIAAADAAQRLADQLRSLVPATDGTPERPERRTPLPLPGGVISTSAEAAEHFARSDAAMLVDGYNVSKLMWPGRSLEQQRVILLDAVENVARRYGTDVTVVFDGADVVGAHAARRRLVRVVYSPPGVLADDVIRDEVRRLPSGRHVVVVTDDREIVRDIRSWGANPLPSAAFAALL